MQLIAAAWANSMPKSSGAKKVQASAVQKQIRRLLEDKSFAPLGSRVGVPLVNVLEINLALEDLFQKPAAEK